MAQEHIMSRKLYGGQAVLPANLIARNNPPDYKFGDRIDPKEWVTQPMRPDLLNHTSE